MTMRHALHMLMLALLAFSLAGCRREEAFELPADLLEDPVVPRSARVDDSDWARTTVEISRSTSGSARRGGRKKGQVNIGALKGRTRKQLGRLFKGDSNTVSDKTGRKMTFGFNAKGHLAFLKLVPPSPISESNAVEMVSGKYGVELPQGKCVKEQRVHAYRNLEGPVATVHLVPAVAGGKEFLVREIGLYFDIGWNE